MQIDLGHFILILSWLMCMWALVFGVLGALRMDRRYIETSSKAIQLSALGSLVSLVALSYAFVSHDYSNLYVWQHSSNDMPWYYLVSAVWGGMDGSMLLWAAISCLFGYLAIRKPEMIPERMYAWVLPCLAAASGFFLTVVVFFTNPFREIPGTQLPLDGNGLNPLLQNPSMMIHPPMLYLGFTGFVVPFAFCMAALLSKNLGTSWITLTRNWTLLAWSFLTFGVMLGGHWAYIELGWGGFWAWDPVENASFMPWLVGTALLHSVMVQQHRGMLKVWNVVLATLTYGLTVFGTFLTRSGVVQSVHAFAETDVGWVFLLYLGALSLLSFYLILLRKNELSPDNSLQSYFSREAAFLWNNLLLLAICFVTLWGVMLPVISEALQGEKIVVGPPFFNAVNNPLFLGLLFLMAVGPMIAWRKSSISQLKKLFLLPFAIGSILSISLFIFDRTRPLTALSFGLSVFVIVSVLREFYRTAKSRALSNDTHVIVASGSLIRLRLRRYSAHLVHMGVAFAAISITAASSYKIERDLVMGVGDVSTVGSYTFSLEKVLQDRGEGYGILKSRVRLSNAETGEAVQMLEPEKRIYDKSGEVTTEVDIRSTLLEDVYIAFAGLEQGSGDEMRGVFKVFINPFQMWLWVSGLLIIVGSVVLCIEGFYAQAILRSSTSKKLSYKSEVAV